MLREQQELSLAAGFPSATRDDWRAKAAAVLSKSGIEAVSPEAALSWRSYDDVLVAPLYDAADAPTGSVLGRGVRDGVAVRWEVRQRHTVADPELVLADLENGVDSLWLAIAPGCLSSVLRDVYLDLVSVALDAGEDTVEAAGTLFALADAKGVSPGALRGTLGADPFAVASRTGRYAGLSGGIVSAVTLAKRCAAGYPGLRAMTVDALPYHDAGAGDAEELALSVATGVAYLRAMTDAGLTAPQAFGQLEFRYAATADQFTTIAKLRAARRLWARVAEVAGGPGEQFQHAVTSSAMMTARDPWVNMLRTTLACFAAGVGGADAVTVQPFDAALGLPDAFARRIARNTHSLLMDEAHVARVSDPAAGSWYVEWLTTELAMKAWEWFQEIEAAGGIASALRSGLVPDRLSHTRERRRADIAHRRNPITGVSEFPSLDEKPLRRTPERRRANGGLPVVRYAEEFEALRDLADAQDRRPVVFLATIGPVAAHTPRATFATNLFAAGGIAVVTSGPQTDPAVIAGAFRAAGTPVACICSSDRLYGEHAEAVAAALRAAGAAKVLLAGRGEYAGVDAAVSAGSDALALLRTIFDDLGVAR